MNGRLKKFRLVEKEYKDTRRNGFEGGGTWLGLTNSGKVAALTNLPSIEKIPEKTKSRGLLIKDFLPIT